VRLGVPGLDELWGGSLAPGASVALTGPAQSGKTWFAVQFLLAGAERGDLLLYAKVSPRKEARETLPLTARLAELEKSGRATLQSERLNRPLTAWLGTWLEQNGKEARVAIEVASSIDELSPREASWLADAQRELAARGVAARLQRTDRPVTATVSELALVKHCAARASMQQQRRLRCASCG
jgi:KaiC/GvpD/RAD55 family RecA-like ATPase